MWQAFVAQGGRLQEVVAYERCSHMEVRLYFITDRPCWKTKSTNEGLALETYALKPLQGGQFTCADKTNFCVFHSRTQHHWETSVTALFFEESIFSHSYIYIKEARQG